MVVLTFLVFQEELMAASFSSEEEIIIIVDRPFIIKITTHKLKIPLFVGAITDPK